MFPQFHLLLIPCQAEVTPDTKQGKVMGRFPPSLYMNELNSAEIERDSHGFWRDSFFSTASSQPSLEFGAGQNARFNLRELAYNLCHNYSTLHTPCWMQNVDFNHHCNAMQECIAMVVEIKFALSTPGFLHFKLHHNTTVTILHTHSRQVESKRQRLEHFFCLSGHWPVWWNRLKLRVKHSAARGLQGHVKEYVVKRPTQIPFGLG